MSDDNVAKMIDGKPAACVRRNCKRMDYDADVVVVAQDPLDLWPGETLTERIPACRYCAEKVAEENRAIGNNVWIEWKHDGEFTTDFPGSRKVNGMTYHEISLMMAAHKIPATARIVYGYCGSHEVYLVPPEVDA